MRTHRQNWLDLFSGFRIALLALLGSIALLALLGALKRMFRRRGGERRAEE